MFLFELWSHNHFSYKIKSSLSVFLQAGKLKDYIDLIFCPRSCEDVESRSVQREFARQIVGVIELSRYAPIHYKHPQHHLLDKVAINFSKAEHQSIKVDVFLNLDVVLFI